MDLIELNDSTQRQSEKAFPYNQRSLEGGSLILTVISLRVSVAPVNFICLKGGTYLGGDGRRV